MRAAVIFFILAMPRVVFGGIAFTEIMYDPEGADTGREWVEIRNDGGEAVDLTGFKFFEEGVNHGLTAVSGDFSFPPGGFAIVADNADKFKIDFPSFSGILFDSSFSLKNTGEELSIKNKDLNVISSAIYDAALGGNGDGNSLQKNSSGNWIAAIPAPGTGYSPASASAPEESSSLPPSIPVSSPNNSNWPVEPQVFADAGKDKVIVVGANVTFEGRAYGLKKEPLENARFVWNFGDGSVAEGKNVSHAYRHPGDYIVVLDVASGYFSGSDRLNVRAEASPLKISSITDGKEYFIELSNSSNSDVDISSWWLALGGKKFEIPKNTFVMGGKRLVFGNDVTGISVAAGSVPELRYPNETLAHRYGGVSKTALPAAKAAAAATLAPIKTASANVSEEIPVDNANLAATAESGTGFNYSWLLGVLAISATAVGGIVLIQKRERAMDEADRLAREIEIVE